jgi:hypothetical protein
MKNVLNITSVLLVVVLIFVVVCCMKKNKENYLHWENLAPWPISWRPYPSPKEGRTKTRPFERSFDLESKKISNRCHELTKLGCGLIASCPSENKPGGSGWKFGSYPCADWVYKKMEDYGTPYVRVSNCNSNEGDVYGPPDGGGSSRPPHTRKHRSYGWYKKTNHCGNNPDKRRGGKCANWTKECNTQLSKEWWEYYVAEQKKITDEKQSWLGANYAYFNEDNREGKEKPDKNWECTEKTKARDLNKQDSMGDQEFADGKFSINLKNMTRKGCADACKNKKYHFQVGEPETECKSLDYNTSADRAHNEYTCRLFSGKRRKNVSDEGKATGWTYCVKKYDETDNAYCKADGPAAVWENGNMTGSLSISVTEAKKKCDLDDTCKGFTVEKNSGKIILKNKIDGSNKKSNYSCYVKEVWNPND